MATIKNEAGEEIEVLTPEEVDQKLAEKDKEYQDKLLEVQGNLNKLSEEKAELEKKMGDTKQDHPNFKILKDALEKKDSDIKSLKDTVENDKKQRLQEAMDMKIKVASKGNEEFEKKVKFHLSNTLTGMSENTEEERTKKIEAAIKLSADYSAGSPGIFDGGIGGGSMGDGTGAGSGGETVEFTAKERALGAKLGLTPEDYKKYANRVSKRK